MIDASFWRGKRCFVTGHTGFKGAWLTAMLHGLGAEVSGYSLAPTRAQMPLLASIDSHGVNSTYGDLRDEKTLAHALVDARPQVLFHLAAQPLVRRSYREPLETFETNIMGTARVLEAARRVSTLQSIVVITTDKCYADDGERVARRESDPLGGSDPYAASKAAAELIAACYRAAFFAKEHPAALATARAGNVIGGGDFSEDRIVPDLMRAARDRVALVLRAPHAIRPWQHVLDALGGYLLLAQRLCSPEADVYARAWNFGPRELEPFSVRTMAELLVHHLDRRVAVAVEESPDAVHEAAFLQIDAREAHAQLGWSSQFDFATSVALTAAWYRTWLQSGDLKAITREQVQGYLTLARTRKGALA